MNVNGVIASAKQIKQDFSNVQVRFGVATLIPGKKPFLDFVNQIKENSLNFKLHWSLHSIKEETRRSLMPAANDIKESINLLNFFMAETNLPVEIHYTLMDNLNDSKDDADQIAKLINKKATIKLLRFSPHKNEPFLIESKQTKEFKKMLENHRFNVEIYSPPGRDINASCGQFILDQYSK